MARWGAPRKGAHHAATELRALGGGMALGHAESKLREPRQEVKREAQVEKPRRS